MIIAFQSNQTYYCPLQMEHLLNLLGTFIESLYVSSPFTEHPAITGGSWMWLPPPQHRDLHADQGPRKDLCSAVLLHVAVNFQS